MTTYKKILNIALPAMVENFLQMLMGMVDSYLVASLGLVAISGVSVAGNVITIYQAIFIALGAAVSSLISKSLGEGDRDNLAYHTSEAIKLTLILSVFLGLFSLVFGRQILAWLGTEPVVANAGGLYLALIGGTILLLGLMTTLGSLIRATSNPRMPMYISFLSNLLNVLFSSLAIFIFHMGIVGVALGTILARLVGVFILWKELSLPLAPWSWKLDWELLRLSLPAAGERLMMRAGDVVMIAIIVKFGTDAVAGNAIGEVLTQFNYMPSFGVATATVMFLFGFGQPLTQLYTTAGGAVQASLSVILFSLLGVPMTAGTVIYTAVWQGLGNAKLPFYATTVGMWLIRIVAGYFLGVRLGLGLPGVWTATLLDNGFRWLFLQILYQRKMRERT